MSSSWDVIIIGAGISGINAAYRVKERLPHLSFTVLEGRNSFGGTWDLFKYPGVRSDSDMYTFSYPFHPYDGGELLTSGEKIKAYLMDTMRTYDLEKHIQYNRRVEGAEWSSQRQRWRLNVKSSDGLQQLESRFVMFSTGYYDYSKPLAADIPGIDDFQGQTIHPQFWPKDFDPTNKHITIIGSGATAATLVPNLAKQAKQVVMLQRSPSYFIAVPNRNALAKTGLMGYLPSHIRYRLVRFRLALLQFFFFWYCGKFPNSARRFFYKNTKKHLPKDMPLEPHFTPSYRPWEQRVCATPNGDFFESLRDGKASVVTGKIKAVTKTGIEMENGERVQTDVIVTATGLQLLFAGGASITVDGKKMNVTDLYYWHGFMLKDIPNASFSFGYPNASWTLGADLTSVGFTRVIKQLEDDHMESATPTVAEGKPLKDLPVMSLSSTYLSRAKELMPKGGDQAPWLPRRNYFADWWGAWYGDLQDGLVYH